MGWRQPPEIEVPQDLVDEPGKEVVPTDYQPPEEIYPSDGIALPGVSSSEPSPIARHEFSRSERMGGDLSAEALLTALAKLPEHAEIEFETHKRIKIRKGAPAQTVVAAPAPRRWGSGEPPLSQLLRFVAVLGFWAAAVYAMVIGFAAAEEGKNALATGAWFATLILFLVGKYFGRYRWAFNDPYT